MKSAGIDRLYVGQAILLNRSRAGLSQKDLAERTRIHSSLISKYENGKAPLGRANLEKISAALGVTSSKIFEDARELSRRVLFPQNALPEPVFPEGELGRIWDESVENAKNLHLRSCRALFDALLKAIQAR